MEFLTTLQNCSHQRHLTIITTDVFVKACLLGANGLFETIFLISQQVEISDRIQNQLLNLFHRLFCAIVQCYIQVNHQMSQAEASVEA